MTGECFRRSKPTVIRPLTCLFLLAILFVGCNRKLASAKGKLKRTTSADLIAVECERLLKDNATTQRWLWKPDALTNYPMIFSLNPQSVQIVELGGTSVCDIQLTGGFSHSGILYSRTGPHQGTVFRRGDWQVKPIGHGFYWYQE
jgi:hypothetical protein